MNHALPPITRALAFAWVLLSPIGLVAKERNAVVIQADFGGPVMSGVVYAVEGRTATEASWLQVGTEEVQLKVKRPRETPVPRERLINAPLERRRPRRR